MHQIEYKAAKLQAQKLQMANESSRAYDEYLDALEATKVQYKFLQQDGSIDFKDATYDALCVYGMGSSDQFALMDSQTGGIYLPADVADAYNNCNGNQEQFATILSEQTQGNVNNNPVNQSPSQNQINSSESDNTNTSTDAANSQNTVPVNNTLNMGDVITFDVGAEPATISLADGFNAGNKYIISSQEGNSQVTMRYLDNGRLEVTANNCIIQEEHSQVDDIILIGDGNTISTGSMDDIVRVGGAIGFISADGSTQSDNNIINTGDGNDHVTLYGINNELDLGLGNDSINYVTAGVSDKTSVVGNEINYGAVNANYDYNYDIEAASQGSLGDCRFLAMLASLENIQDYVDISGDEDGGWDVTFKNYTAGPNTVHVTKDSLDSNWVEPSWQDSSSDSNGNGSRGDLDIRLAEYALNKLINDSTGHSLKTASYQELSRYMLGNDDVSIYLSSANSGGYGDYSINGSGIVSCDETTDVTKELVQNLFAQYQEGSITNITCGLQSGNDSIQLAGSHAYAIKNVSENSITLINPWDNQDELQLTWDDFLSNVNTLVVYGDDTNKPNGEVYNNSVSTTTNIENIENSSVQNINITMTNTVENVIQPTVSDLDIIVDAPLDPTNGGTSMPSDLPSQTGSSSGSSSGNNSGSSSGNTSGTGSDNTSGTGTDNTSGTGTGGNISTTVPTSTEMGSSTSQAQSTDGTGGTTTGASSVGGNGIPPYQSTVPIPADVDPDKYLYYYNLFTVIEGCGGNITVIPEDMRNSNEFLTNVINGGFAYLKSFNKGNDE
ncbi:hypothetical protein IKJ53_04885, partial [bacterium]|nr:hypothetical protein [bacterium]